MYVWKIASSLCSTNICRISSPPVSSGSKCLRVMDYYVALPISITFHVKLYFVVLVCAVAVIV